MEFVAYVGTDKENWGQITALMNRLEAEKSILVMSKQAVGFPLNDRCEVVSVDPTKPMVEFKEDILNKLKPIVKGDFEVTVSLASGTGKEHMALIAALLNAPVGVKLVVYTKEGIQFLT
jgi:hypothetical protein